MTLLDPAPLDPPAPTTLGRRAELALERLGDAPALLFEGAWHSSAELAARARAAAGGFAALGVGPGDRVIVCMTNCPEVGITYNALWRAGAVPTPVLFLLTEDELRHVAQDSGACAVVTTPEWLAKVRAAMPTLPVVVVGDLPDADTAARCPSRSSSGAPSSRLVDARRTTWPPCSTPAAPPVAARASS